MQVITTRCDCGAVFIEVGLSRPLADYQPRQCDCDFCTERTIQYISDTKGVINITTSQPLVNLTQGSAQARFLQCANCQTVVAVSYQEQQSMLGAVNIMLFGERGLMQPAMIASPKLLAPEEKLSRWRQLWMPLQLKINTAAKS